MLKILIYTSCCDLLPFKSFYGPSYQAIQPNMQRYNYIKGFKNELPDKTQLGFISQQVKQHFPKSVSRNKIKFDDNREIPDLSTINIDQVNFTLFGAVKYL